MYVSWSLLLYYSYFGVDNKKKKKRVIATAATSVMSSVMVIRFVLSSSFQTIEHKHLLLRARASKTIPLLLLTPWPPPRLCRPSRRPWPCPAG